MQGPVGVLIFYVFNEALFIIDLCDELHIEYDLREFDDLHWLFVFDDYEFLEFIVNYERMSCSAGRIIYDSCTAFSHITTDL